MRKLSNHDNKILKKILAQKIRLTPKNKWIISNKYFLLVKIILILNYKKQCQNILKKIKIAFMMPLLVILIINKKSK